jgi:hypothetical protein
MNRVSRTLQFPQAFLRTLLRRGAVLWLVARLAAMAVHAMAVAMYGKSGVVDGDLSGVLPIWTLALAPCLVYLDLRRRRELMLLHNLGVTTASAIAIGVIPAMLLEAALQAFPL